MPVPTTVQTSMEFIIPPEDNSAPYYYINIDPVDGIRQKNYALQAGQAEVENIRGRENEFNLNNAGFQHFRIPTRTTDFSSDKEVEKNYYPECKTVIKQLTGASRVVLFDHTIRRNRPGQLVDNPEQRKPVTTAHVDQTPQASEARVHKHLPQDEVPALLKKRYQIINLWRPITNIALDWPLALCDFRSVDSERDMIPVSLVYPNREPGEIYNVKHNPNHKWKYFRGMETDEGILIKCFDSIQDGSVAGFAPHTAFADPTTPPGSPLRESIEVRALVFYD